MSTESPMDDIGGGLRRLVRDRAGLDLRHISPADLARAARRLTAGTGLRDAELEAFVSGQSAVFENLVADLTIGETYFLRDHAQLEALEHDILPGLVDRRRRAGSRRLRLWSAGCSTGEEAYTLAMIVERVIGDLERWNVSILGTDINRGSLAVAERGVYGPWSLRGVPEEVVERCFVRRGDRVVVVPRLRRFVRFALLNLADDVYPSLFTDTVAVDVVMCRNTLMYFHDRVGREVVGRLRAALADGGWLLLGVNEWARARRPDLVPHPLPTAAAFAACRPRTAEPRREALVPAGLADPRRQGAGPIHATPVPVPGRADDPVPFVLAPSVPALPVSALSGPAPSVPALSGPAASVPVPSIRELYELAKERARRLEVQEAERLLGQVLARDRLCAPAHWLLGVVLQEDGRLEAALVELRHCVFADRGFDLGRFALAGLLARLGHSRRAHREFEELARRLRGRPPLEPVAEGDGLTAGRLLHLALVAGAAEAAGAAAMEVRAL